eukprot:SAG25_NODE_4213_length_863_cov_1.010471_2_plen_192_part_01
MLRLLHAEFTEIPHKPGFRFAINIDSSMLQVYTAAGEVPGSGGRGWSAVVANGTIPKLVVLPSSSAAKPVARQLLYAFCASTSDQGGASASATALACAAPHYVLEEFTGGAGAKRTTVVGGEALPLPPDGGREPLQAVVALSSLAWSAGPTLILAADGRGIARAFHTQRDPSKGGLGAGVMLSNGTFSSQQV